MVTHADQQAAAIFRVEEGSDRLDAGMLDVLVLVLLLVEVVTHSGLELEGGRLALLDQVE